jgi:hypothetical protein
MYGSSSFLPISVGPTTRPLRVFLTEILVDGAARYQDRNVSAFAIILLPPPPLLLLLLLLLLPSPPPLLIIMIIIIIIIIIIIMVSFIYRLT